MQVAIVPGTLRLIELSVGGLTAQVTGADGTCTFQWELPDLLTAVGPVNEREVVFQAGDLDADATVTVRLTATATDTNESASAQATVLVSDVDMDRCKPVQRPM